MKVSTWHDRAQQSATNYSNKQKLSLKELERSGEAGHRLQAIISAQSK